mmetsp:Transcript_40471/g.52106  ORF Transcript_40471/g.52106 Transcript_40471/m.52106 type:complete len:327 (+) Transcript_40471:111-1091(+)|eukprot:CAMPEP_0114333358 /NCGR_PEP_ID=MMETSP0101-20121206/3710_1 /TAXON_ID=38822 ORGANISM="Pteridomonas danica, Strain PT" /NCGR_SAMPLE_ID=MMETSP0101 /ASSEMBLY_ACC=CAM_ASM_000211 /LENGTH=326 /DNA_ID=CAMNT_0001464367 /DNA_START=71 /DNA_END=1051 /DNA_ORIENTATION=+
MDDAPESKRIKKDSTHFIQLIESGDLKAVKDFMDSMAEVDGATAALMFATYHQNVPLIKLLISSNIDLNQIETTYIKSSNNSELLQIEETALMLATKNNDIKIVHIFIEAKVALNIQNKDGETALMIAVSKGLGDIARELIKAKADVDIQDNNGDSPLISASRFGQLSLLRELVKAKANVNLHNSFNGDRGLSALMYAIQGGRIDMMNILIEAGADLDYTIFRGKKTALMLAAESELESDITNTMVQLLVQKGVSLDLQNTFGETALMTSVRCGNVSNVKLLKASKANLRIRNHNELTALEIAVMTQHGDPVSGPFREIIECLCHP